MVLFCGHVGEITTTSVYDMVGNNAQLSVAVALPVAAGSVFAEQAMVILAGQVIAGPDKSLTIIC